PHRDRRSTARAFGPRRHRRPAPRSLPGRRRLRAVGDAPRPLRPASASRAGRSGRGGDRSPSPPFLRSGDRGSHLQSRRAGRDAGRRVAVRLGVGAALVDGSLVPGDVEVADGRIVGVGLSTANGSGVAAPGFVDLQVNGFAGVDFFSADTSGYRKSGEVLLHGGVTAYQPTFITSPEDELTAALQEVPQNGSMPRIIGAHLEGP